MSKKHRYRYLDGIYLTIPQPDGRWEAQCLSDGPVPQIKTFIRHCHPDTMEAIIWHLILRLRDVAAEGNVAYEMSHEDLTFAAMWASAPSFVNIVHPHQRIAVSTRPDAHDLQTKIAAPNTKQELDPNWHFMLPPPNKPKDWRQ